VNIGLQKRLLFGFLLALGAQGLAGVLLQRNNAAFHVAQNQVANGHAVTVALQEFLTSAEDAETGQRGYVLTGDPSYLKPYDQALSEIDDQLQRIQTLTADDSSQQSLVNELRKHVRSKLNELGATVELVRTQGIEAARRRVLSGIGKREMDEIRGLVEKMRQDERSRAEYARQQFESSAQRRDQFIVGTIATQFVLLGLVFLFGYRSAAYRERSAFQLLQEHVRMAAILQTIGEGLYQVDRNGRIVYVNPVGEQLLGYQAEEVVGRSAHEIVHRGGEDGRTCGGEDCPLVAVTSRGERGRNASDWLRRKDGSVITVEHTCSPLVQYEVINGGVVVFRDISERARMENALRDSEERYRNLVENSRGLICTHDMQGKLLTVNEASAEALGYKSEELEGRNLKELLAPAFRDNYAWYLKAIAEWGGHSGLMRVQTKEGEELVWSYSNRVIRGEDGAPYVLGHAHDVTAQVLSEEALKVSEEKLQAALESEKNLSRIDFLTGIPNRRSFFQALTTESRRARRYRRPMTVAYIDVDNFKQVNDGLGHAVGDELLKTIGKGLETTLRETDTAARLGGDEFAILLPETDADSASVVMAKVQAGLDKAMQQRNWSVSFSVGVVTFTTAPGSAEEMVQRADELMYEVKRKGKSAMVSQVV
jgi:diguanylate cyclase (GGDEF)-like protein/PAS domain S-box-containing protein